MATDVASARSVRRIDVHRDSGASIVPKPIGDKAKAATIVTSNKFPDWIRRAPRSSK